MSLESPALDLDAELREAQDNGYTPTAQMIVYLIQRLQKAEARVKRQDDIADKALAGWQHDQAKWFEASARIAQLERVREAALEFLVVPGGPELPGWYRAHQKLRDALGKSEPIRD